MNDRDLSQVILSGTGRVTLKKKLVIAFVFSFLSVENDISYTNPKDKEFWDSSDSIVQRTKNKSLWINLVHSYSDITETVDKISRKIVCGNYSSYLIYLMMMF